MRILSLIVPVYAVGALIYLGAGGKTDWPLGVVHGLVMVGSVVLVVRSILHIRANPGLGANDKMTWVLLTLFMGFVALPVYWFVIAPRSATS